PTSESACLSGEKSARIRSAAVRHQARRMQGSNLIPRCLGCFENSQGDRSQCKSHHSSEVRHERNSGNLCHETVRMMTAFWPWVRKQEIECFHRSRRQQIANRIGTLYLQQPHVALINSVTIRA